MNLVRAVWWAAGVAAVAAEAAVVHGQGAWSWTGRNDLVWWSALLAGVALVTAAATVHRLDVPAVAWLAGVAWLLPDLAGDPSLAIVPATAAAASAWVVPSLLVLTVLSWTGSSVRSRIAALAMAGSLVGVLTRLTLVDPFRDVDCWRLCRSNPLARDAAGWLASALSWLALLLLAAAVVMMVVAARPSSARWPAWWGAGAATLLMASLAPSSPARVSVVPVALQLAAAVCAAGLAATLMSDELRERLARRRLVRLVLDMEHGPTPGHVEDALRTALGDPYLRVAYCLPEQGLVDAEGRPVALPDDGGPRLTVGTRSGRRLAVLVLSQAVEPRVVERTLGPALRLALENDQLRAAQLFRLHEIARSRRRILERAHEERRRLERNLHDGAQQRVVSLLLLLRMLASRVQGSDALAVTAAAERAGALLEELRQIARGIHPAVVADAGLVGAVGDLAEGSTDVPVTVDLSLPAELSPLAQSTAYEFVATVLADARAGDATAVAVRSTVSFRRMSLAVHHDAARSPDTDDLDGVATQAEALSGAIRVGGRERRWHVTLELPCGS